MKTTILSPSKANIKLAANAIRAGELVAFPTETVYGLGANALDEGAVAKIYEAKGRPSDNPLIVHLGDKNSIGDFACLTDAARLLIDAFMPGAITILLKKRDCIPSIVTAGRQTVGIRIPNNEVAISFLKLANVPVCAPSANTSTRPSPTAAQHVYDDLIGKIGYILDGGSCEIGIESTIVDVSSENAVLLRKGGVLIEEIEAVLKTKLIIADNLEEALSPGLKYRHYSPKAKVIMVNNSQKSIQSIADIYLQQCSLGCKTAILCYNKDTSKLSEFCTIGMGNDPNDYAKNYYATLRQLDKEGYDVIICHAPEQAGIGLSLNNRIKKSAGGEWGEKKE